MYILHRDKSLKQELHECLHIYLYTRISNDMKLALRPQCLTQSPGAWLTTFVKQILGLIVYQEHLWQPFPWNYGVRRGKEILLGRFGLFWKSWSPRAERHRAQDFPVCLLYCDICLSNTLNLRPARHKYAKWAWNHSVRFNNVCIPR